MEKKILVIDDETNIVELIKFNLENNGYKVFFAYRGSDALKIIEKEDLDLIILDLMLPDIDGLEICKLIKKNDKTAEIPIIMLTAKSDEFDKVLGLELGAEDYITKPFSVRELMARIKNIVRRSAPNLTGESIIRIGPLTIDMDKYEVLKNNEKLDLTIKEFELLKLLATNSDKVFTRDLLMDKIWGYDYDGDTRTVDVHIRYLRQKIEDNDKRPKYIETIRGVGYKFSGK